MIINDTNNNNMENNQQICHNYIQSRSKTERHNRHSRNSYHRNRPPGVKKQVVDPRFPRQKPVDKTGWTTEQHKLHSRDIKRRAREKKRVLSNTMNPQSPEKSQSNAVLTSTPRLPSTPAPRPFVEQLSAFTTRPPTPIELHMLQATYSSDANRALLSETVNNAFLANESVASSNSNIVSSVCSVLAGSFSPFPQGGKSMLANSARAAPHLESVWETEDELESKPSNVRKVLLLSELGEEVLDSKPCTVPCKRSVDSPAQRSSTKKLCPTSHHSANRPPSVKKVCIYLLFCSSQFCILAQVFILKHIFFLMKQAVKKGTS